jgi:hypothetical protein
MKSDCFRLTTIILSVRVQSLVEKLEYVGLQILPARDLHEVCSVPIALLETCYVARVDPKNPMFWVIDHGSGRRIQ